MSSTLKTVYEFDANGYYVGPTVWQVIDGEPLKAPNTTDLVPWGAGEQDATVFYRFVDGAWTQEKKPTCAADLVGVEVSHTDMTPHGIELRTLAQELGTEEGYTMERGTGMSWKIVKVPEKTAEEKKAEAESTARAKRDALIAATDFLVMPDYPISEEDLAAVKEYRQALRDVPEQEGFPDSITWPTAPSIVDEASK